MISLLHTTAQRDQWWQTADIWRGLAHSPDKIEHVLAYETSAFPMAPWTTPFEFKRIVPVDGASPVVGWNRAARVSLGSVLVVMADDLFPTQDWDAQILDDIPGWQHPPKQKALWYASVDADGNELWHDIMTHPILTRAYWLRYGYVLHPAYCARFSDPEFTEVAKRDGVIIDHRHDRPPWRHQNNQLPGKHHPATERLNRLHAQDEQTYQARKLVGFPREWKAWTCEFSMTTANS